MGELELFIWHGDEPGFLVCKGDVDITTAGRVREAIEVCLDANPRVLCIDGCGITSLGPAGVDALIDGVALCRERGVEIELALSAVAERVVQLCAAETLLDADVSMPRSSEEPSARR